MEILLYLAVAVGAYLLGSFSSAIIISSNVEKKDIRNYGSGNAGATNMLRTFGWLPGVGTFVLDVAKGLLATWLGWLVAGNEGMHIAALFVVIGHNWPVYYGFRGGKGILSSAALAIMMDWRIFVIGFSLFLIIVFATHYVSLGSILAATAYAVLFVIFFPGQPWIWSIAIAMAVLAIFMHRSNIARLLHGTETKTYLLKSKKK